MTLIPIAKLDASTSNFAPIYFPCTANQLVDAWIGGARKINRGKVGGAGVQFFS